MIVLFHGSSVEVTEPDIGRSRTEIDFGAGFYLTEDEIMACKWACSKNRSVINKYVCDTTGLNVKRLNADMEWFNYVMANRLQTTKPFDDSVYDLIIGPTADDRMYSIFDAFTDGYISEDNAVKVINCMQYSEQYVFKNQSAIKDTLRFEGSRELIGSECQMFKEQFKADREKASKRTRELLLKINRGY